MIHSIYLDNATLTPPSRELLQSMWTFYETEWANPASPHDLGQNSLAAISQSYVDIQTRLSLPDGASCVITSSGAEATTQAVQSLLRHQLYEHGKNHIVLARFHDAATTMAIQAEKENGSAFYTYVDADQSGVITKEALLAAIGPRTAFIAFPLVHPLIGVIQPMDELYEIASKMGIPCLVDISNAIGTTMIDIGCFDLCYYVVRGEAIGVPRGTAGLLIQMPSAPKLQPIIYGSEFDMVYRGGSLNVAGSVGIAHALQLCKEKEVSYCTEVRHMQQIFQEKLLMKLGSESISFPFSTNEMCAPHIVCAIFHGVKNEMLLYHLNKKKVYATIGGCGFQNLTNILEGLSPPIENSFSGISFGLSHMTTENEVIEACERIFSCYTMLKKISPSQ